MIFLKRVRLVPIAMLLVLAFTSCDNDFNTLGGRLIGGQFDSLPRYKAGVTAYSQKLGPVQSNASQANLLGVYNDPVFGLETASVLTQLSLSTNAPVFGTEPVVDSVVLTLPYYSTVVDQDTDGTSIYRLDSLYGTAPFKLSVSRSNYFLNDYDPASNFEVAQKYYSNQGPEFESNLIGTPLYVNENFLPSNNDVSFQVFNEKNELDTVTVSPRLRINLPAQFFQENILDKEGSTELSNNNNFKNYLRGLYFKAEPLNNDGSMMLLNFAAADAGITIYYTMKVVDTQDSNDNGDTTDLISNQSTFQLGFGPNTVSTFKTDFPAEVEASIAASTPEFGAENLYLKGGEGVITVINLFEDAAELQEIRANEWLINEANLTFFVDQQKVEGGKKEPELIYLYNLETNEPLLDYSLLYDATTNENQPATSAISQKGKLVRTEDGNGVSYKIRITDHVNRILNQDSTNVKLGLVITPNLNILRNVAVKTPVDGINRIPVPTVRTPEGTVLHGNLSPVTAKRIQFNIYYTETNN